jgi:AcrR family transcriptional regulator
MTIAATATSTVDPHAYQDVINRILPKLRNRPQQARAMETLRSLVAAADDLINEVGVDRFRMEDLAPRAGVAQGTIYRYFTDRVDILDALAPNRHAAAQRLDAVRAHLEALEVEYELRDADLTAGNVIAQALNIIRGTDS